MSLQNAFLGSLVTDAVSMPVHWYYNRIKLDRDYGDFTGYCKPRIPTRTVFYGAVNLCLKVPKLTFWEIRSNTGENKGFITTNFLEAGENTLNLQLAAELYRDSIFKWRLRTRDLAQKICPSDADTRLASGHLCGGVPPCLFSKLCWG